MTTPYPSAEYITHLGEKEARELSLIINSYKAMTVHDSALINQTRADIAKRKVIWQKQLSELSELLARFPDDATSKLGFLITKQHTTIQTALTYLEIFEYELDMAEVNAGTVFSPDSWTSGPDTDLPPTNSDYAKKINDAWKNMNLSDIDKMIEEMLKGPKA